MIWRPWQTRAARRWQEDALPAILGALSRGERPIVSAVMGAGKSALIAELVASNLGGGPTILVTVPTQALVEQTSRVISDRVGGPKVGEFYQHAKETSRPVIIACHDSIGKLPPDLKVRLWLADEVHKTETDNMIESVKKLDPFRAVGFTATPFRSQKKEALSLWDTIAYRYSPADAIKDGVIVPWEIHPWIGEAEELDQACIKMIKRWGKGPGLVNATSIEDAERFADLLKGYGINASAIHSRMTREHRELGLFFLENGTLDCLVHVSLLAEGVDLPWLRWLCLRRPVSARVRFCQEIGRVLRSYPGKDRAIYLDPLDLFGAHGITYPEALGWVEPSTEGEVEEALEERGVSTELRKTVPTDPVSAYCRRLLLVLQAEGALPAGKIPNNEWRRFMATESQVSTINKMIWAARWLPSPHELRAKMIAGLAPDLPRGALADLLDILFYLANKKGGWPPIEVEPIPLEDLQALNNAPSRDPGPWYCATAYKGSGSHAVILVFHDDRVIESRVFRHESSVPLVLEMEAVIKALELSTNDPDPEIVTSDSFLMDIWEGRKQPRHLGVAKIFSKLQELKSRARISLVPKKDNPASPLAWREWGANRKRYHDGKKGT